MSTRWIRWSAAPIVAIGIVLVSFGCARTPTTEQSAASVGSAQSDAKPSVEKAREAAQMAVAIEKEPKRLTEILEAHGMTPETFQDLLYKIAQDPQLTEAYEAARTEASS
jgi:hypothetical protein